MLNSQNLKKNNIDVFISTKEDDINTLTGVINIFNGRSPSGNTIGNISILNTPASIYGWDDDYSMILDAFSKTTDPNNYVIVCKDSTISGYTSDIIYMHLENAINSSELDPINSFDIFYLAFWADRCDLHHNTRNSGDTGLKIANTVSPNGIQCLMFSPYGRQKFLKVFNPTNNPVMKATSAFPETLGHKIQKKLSSACRKNDKQTLLMPEDERFYATCTNTPLVNFDVTKRKSDAELIKMNACRNPPPTQPIEGVQIPNKVTFSPDIENKNVSTNVSNQSLINQPIEPVEIKSSSMSVFWFIVVIIIVIIIIVILFKYFGTPSKVVYTPMVVDTSSKTLLNVPVVNTTKISTSNTSNMSASRINTSKSLSPI
jgi:hypothetical protein